MLPAALQLLKFVDAADDGIVLLILRCLGTAALVRLASTSAFISSRLEDGGPSVLHRYVAELLAFRCPAPALQRGLPCVAPLRALCAAGSGRGHCEVLGLALLVSNSDADADMARMFLDAMFRWELYGRRGAAQSNLQARRAVEILLTALLDPRTEVGCKLLTITAKAICQAERDLDVLIETHSETLLSYCGQGYEATARRRSAAEFIRRRAREERAPPRPLTSAGEQQMQALDAAIESLDQTIWGYDQEGYTLACPQLVGYRHLRRMDLPYEHWWVRLDGPVIGRLPLRALAMAQ
eukprot:Skav216480  [mRNA]  locus=scaffold1123:370150:386858:- [translate_table: standard]